MMKPYRKSLNYFLLILFTFIVSVCSDAKDAPLAIVGSTPGDELIKSLLTIHPDKEVDFIRWNLILNDTRVNQHTFSLNITYGVSQPNTLGFKAEEKLAFEGTYTIAESKNEILHGLVYHFKSSTLPSGIMMVKLNDNLFHLLTPEYRLMNGNGGWSYTLNRKEVIQTDTDVLPALTTSSSLLNEVATQVTFDGRTPCQDIASYYHLKVSSSCFKLKWKLILNRDPNTHAPTTYTIRKVVDNQPRDFSGNWTIIKGIKENPDVVIYQLDPDDPEHTISLLAGDENVLFFLDKKFKLFTGNSDFSFTLNKRQ